MPAFAGMTGIYYIRHSREVGNPGVLPKLLRTYEFHYYAPKKIAFRGKPMAINFKIFLHRNSDNLHIKLRGDFDGSSAHELLNILKAHNGNIKNIFIHTCSLSSVHPFGLDVFQKYCAVNKLLHSLTFTGDYGDTMAPPGSNLA